MKTPFQKRDKRAYWNDPYFFLGFLKASSFLTLALIINYYAVRHATVYAGPTVPDAVLDSFGKINTWYADYYGELYLQYAVFVFAFFQIRHLLFFMNTLALLIVVRSFFINLTHLGIPAGTIPTTSFFIQGGDLFFSGHMATTFLAALVFWHIKPARILFLALSVAMGVEVLAGHQHYTIDVFADPFITYGVFVFSKKIFSSPSSS